MNKFDAINDSLTVMISSSITLFLAVASITIISLGIVKLVKSIKQ